MSEKTLGNELKEQLMIKAENLGAAMSEEELDHAFRFAEGYKLFLDHGKTEREVVKEIEMLAKQKGFTAFDPAKQYNAGDKVYYNNRGKAMILAVIGTESLEHGVHIAASHIDSPRLDLKQCPFYEDTELALLKTHYYGGIKKYQWTAMPLALHGVVIKKDGTSVEVRIGEDIDDPVFCVTDLLPHLANDQMKRTLADGVRGEELNILIGSLPFREDDLSNRVKLNILKILHDKYGVTERDFISAELELVPAYTARDLGLDRSMVGAYGQDDRVCAYTSLMAALECEAPRKTLVTIFADKEETGSDGNTGLRAAYLKYFIADLARPYGVEGRTVLANSSCLSADVNAAFDPTYPDVHDRRNAAYVNRGVVLTKYTGARGKSGTSDASAEFVAEVNRVFDAADVSWQIGELGKVDQGGGGTVAAYIANLGVDVIDVGVPVLSMHAPFEVTSKLDVYMTYRGFAAYANA